MTDIGRLVREANPVLDESTALTDDEISALLLLAESRSTDMDVKELVTPVEPEPPRQRGWLVAAASFAVILLIVGAAMVFGGTEPETPPPGDDVAPSTTVPSPTTTVESPPVDTNAVSPEVQGVLDAFVLAVNSGDADAVAAHMADSFTYNDPNNTGYPQTQEGWSNELASFALEGGTLTLENCEGVEGGAVCDESWEGPVLEAMYPWPWTFRDTFLIADGLVTRVDGVPLSWPSNYQELRDPIVAWVASFDPDAALVMDQGSALGALSEEQALVWKHYAPIWADEGRPSPGDGEFAQAMVVLKSFEVALNSGSIDNVAPFLAEDFVDGSNPGFVGTVEVYLVNTNFWMEAGTLTAFTECRPADRGIVCTETLSGPMQEAISPWEWNTLSTIQITDGKVVFVDLGEPAGLESLDSVQTQLAAWVQPQDAVAARLISESPNSTNQTTEAARAWLEWAPQWVEAGRP